MKERIKKILIVLIAIIMLPSISYAATFNKDYNQNAQTLVNNILGSGLEASNASKTGTVYTFNNGTNDIGIESGIILDTSGNGGESPNDPDLAALMDYEYGGHTSSLEFTMTATGTLLNFNYVFASGEFDESPQFNDIFGLFVSVNGSAYENIAKITNDDGQEFTVNISNLRNNSDFFTRKGIEDLSTNGVSNVFNAKKEVKKGDTVKIKFVIADVSDDAVDSYVMIETGSLSFDAPDGKIDFTDESLKDLDPNSTYKIIDGEVTYELTSDDEGKIPLVGKDNNENNYNFIGKTLQIIKKGVDDISDSDPQEITIDERPDIPDDVSELTGTPKDIEASDVSVTQTEIRILAHQNQEYSLDNKTWQKADSNGYVIFDNLEPNKEYTVYTRVGATSSSLASESTSGTKITTRDMVKNLTYTEHNYEGEFDGEEHYAYISCDEGVDIKYSESLYGTYKSDFIKFVLPGEYTIYYSMTKNGYYPAYGTLIVRIIGQGAAEIIEPEIPNAYNAKLVDSLDEIISKVSLTDEEISKIQNGKKVEIILEVKDISDSVSSSDKEKIESKLGNNDLGMYLDISLFKKIEGEETTKITKTKSPIKISFVIPDSLLNKKTNVVRTFKVLRLHDGVVTELEVKVNGNIGTIETDEFSTYALVYTDTTVNVINPKTGDNVLFYISLLGLGIVTFVVILLYSKKKINIIGEVNNE